MNSIPLKCKIKVIIYVIMHLVRHARASLMLFGDDIMLYYIIKAFYTKRNPTFDADAADVAT